MAYNISLRYTKGVGDSTIYARLLYGNGFWDFVAKTESATETADCQVFLVEVPDTSEDQSWYYAEAVIPACGPYPLELFDGATNVGNDLVFGTTAAVTTAPGAPGRTLTREQFTVKVLSVLNAYDRTAVGAEDQENVLDAYDGIYQELKDDGLVTWAQGEGETIPIRFVISLVSMVAASELLLNTYPQPQERSVRLKLAAQEAYKKIRRQLASPQDTEVVTAEYF